MNYQEELLKAINQYGTNFAALMSHVRYLADEFEIEYYNLGEASNLSNIKIDRHTVNDLSQFSENSFTSTGFIALDEFIYGWHRGKVHLIDSPPSFGKTRFLINTSLNMSLTNTVLFYSFGMTKEHLAKRIFKSIGIRNKNEKSNIKINQIITNEIFEADYTLLANKYQIRIKDNNPYSIPALINDMCQEVKNENIKWIIIDNIENLFDINNATSIRFQLRSIYAELSDFAETYDVGIIISRENRKEDFCSYGNNLWSNPFPHYGYEDAFIDLILYISSKHYYNYIDECFENISRISIIKNLITNSIVQFPIYDNVKLDYMSDIKASDKTVEYLAEIYSETNSSTFKSIILGEANDFMTPF